MTITYDQIRREAKALSEEIAHSSGEIPGLLSNFKPVALPCAIYFLFYFLSILKPPLDVNLYICIGVFSLVFWFFMAVFLSGYKQMSSMLPKDAENRYEIVRVFKRKSSIYYFTWIAFISLGGLISLLTILNVIALSAITFVVSIFLVITFNIDVSRYQLASAFGVLSAVEEKINGRGN